MNEIKVTGVSKLYGKVTAVRECTFNVPENCLFGLIGPDGAGKTSLFRMITTLLIPDQGNVSVFGYDTSKDYRIIRRFTGYMPGRFSLYPDLTVEENLTFYATIFGTTIKKNYHLISPVYALLEPFKNRLSINLSGGMKQKLALCCALIHNPKLLVLDEPTTGVDAVSRKEFWETLQMLKNSGMTILVSTPYMDEAVRCDSIALIQEGRILVEDKPQAILEDYAVPLFEIRTQDNMRTLEVLRKQKGVKNAYLFGQYIHMAAGFAECNVEWVAARLAEHSIPAARILTIQANFEDCFIEAVENHVTASRS